MSNLTKESEGKYYLEPDTEITKEQYDAINDSTNPGTSGDLSEATILRLHQESDPASPLFKGSEPVDGAVTSESAAGTEPSKSYYEPTADNIDPVADAVPEPQGTTTFTTEEVSKPYEAPEGLPVVESDAANETTQETPQTDAGITGA